MLYVLSQLCQKLICMIIIVLMDWFCNWISHVVMCHMYIHSTKKVSSRQTLFDMQNFPTHILSGHSLSILTMYCEISEFMKSGARKKLHFLSIGLYGASMHDVEIPAQKEHAHNGAPCSPTEQKCHFFPSTQLNKTDVLNMKITINCKEWPPQIVHNNFLYVNFWISKLDEILLELFQKV